MDELLARLGERYELVVIDTAPMGVVSDAFPLLRKVDGVIVAPRIGVSTRDCRPSGRRGCWPHLVALASSSRSSQSRPQEIPSEGGAKLAACEQVFDQIVRAEGPVAVETMAASGPFTLLASGY